MKYEFFKHTRIFRSRRLGDSSHWVSFLFSMAICFVKQLTKHKKASLNGDQLSVVEAPFLRK